MLEFMRRYQRYLFGIVTVIIVFSFSFFGTFSTFLRTNTQYGEQKVCTTIAGGIITAAELRDYINFLSTDSHDNLFLNVVWAGNALNDGVITKDILENKLYKKIIAPFIAEVTEGYQSKIQREKLFSPYVHPKASFISAERVWSYFAPEVKDNLYALINQKDSYSLDAIKARVDLFLSQRKFPSLYLKQILRYQQNQQDWIEEDQALNYNDLSLFGYTTMNDWFGKRFIELITLFIINCAEKAETLGIVVTSEEAEQALFKNAQESFTHNVKNPYLNVTNVRDYVDQQLRRLGMDQNKAVSIWKNILLFRRLFNDINASIFVDNEIFKDFAKQLCEYIQVDVLMLPEQLRFQSIDEMRAFEIYIQAVSKDKEQSLVNIPPTDFVSLEELKKVYPEFVEKDVRLYWKTVTVDQLIAKISAKETWKWQVQEQNWNRIKKQFPELAAKTGVQEDERFQILDGLDIKTRNLVDMWSRQAIVEEHPEWIQGALNVAPEKEETIALRAKPIESPLPGIDNFSSFMAMLEESPLQQQTEALAQYTQDKKHYYQFLVKERGEKWRMLTYAKLKEDGTLQFVMDRILRSAYQRIRNQNPRPFLNETGEWKAFENVRDQVADVYFENMDNQVLQIIEKAKVKYPKLCNWQDSTSAKCYARVLPYIEHVAQEIQNDKSNIHKWTQPEKEDAPLWDQFMLIQKEEKVVRKDRDPLISFDSLKSLADNQRWYPIANRKLGIALVQQIKRASDDPEFLIRKKALQLKNVLGQEGILKASETIIEEMISKKAFMVEIAEEKQTTPHVQQIEEDAV